tara:strand:+ start:13636 stop:15507 length:1872 start_codon:yes stop_codon:yes gene_type:complete
MNIPILRYHEVCNNPKNQNEISIEVFKKQMNFLKKNNFKTINLNDLHEHVTKNTQLPQKPVIIIFDKGRAGVYENAYPIIKELGMNACIFINPNLIEKDSEFMTWDKIKELSDNNFIVGSCSREKVDLEKLSEKELELNLAESKSIIELKINKDINHFYYSYEKPNDKTLQTIKKYYKTAINNLKGTNFLQDKKTNNEINLLELKTNKILNNIKLDNFKLLFTTLSLCMITKNEEKFLQNCLESVQKIVDEIIIIDTGSKDKTKEIAKKYGAEVYDFKWNENFSDARNKSLKYSKSDWVLFLDADETLSENEALKIKQLINQENEIIGYSLITKKFTNNFSQENFYYENNNNYLGASLTKKIRLFKNNQNIQFNGEIYELVDKSIKKINGKVEGKKIFINNFSEEKEKSAEFKKEKIEKYRELCEKRLLKEPNNAKVFYELAQIYRSEDFLELAKQNLLKAVELNENFLEAHQILGVVYTELKEYDKALEILNKTLKINKNYAETYFLLGVVHSKLQNYQKSAEFIETGLKLNKNNINALTNLGAVYEKLGKYDESIKTLNRSLLLHPLNPRTHYNMGFAFIKKNDINNTVKAFNNAIKLGYKDKDRLIRFIENIKNLNKLNS